MFLCSRCLTEVMVTLLHVKTFPISCSFSLWSKGEHERLYVCVKVLSPGGDFQLTKINFNHLNMAAIMAFSIILTI